MGMGLSSCHGAPLAVLFPNLGSLLGIPACWRACDGIAGSVCGDVLVGIGLLVTLLNRLCALLLVLVSTFHLGEDGHVVRMSMSCDGMGYGYSV